jgi:hypothetical protein
MTMDYTVKGTRRKKNPWLATSADGLNQAYGQTKQQAIDNLLAGIAARKANNHE